MAKYRKKPVEIEAFQFTKDLMANASNSNTPEWFQLAVKESKCWIAVENPFDFEPKAIGLNIKTLEGTMLANLDDWIIQGVKGEIYPCKPDIFEATYEAV